MLTTAVQQYFRLAKERNTFNRVTFHSKLKFQERTLIRNKKES